MQSESKKYEEEMPSLYWGLDPVFSAFARLYIKDIKEMRESKQVPGRPSTPSSLTVLEQMKKLQEMVSQKTKLEIGDVVRVRGHIRTYRQEREIQASCFYKVDDPVCDVQISRMLELPCLYREVYDKPFQGPEEGQSALEGQNFSINMLHEKVKSFLLENKIQTFYQQELEAIDTLVSLAGVHLPSPSSPEWISELFPIRHISFQASKQTEFHLRLANGLNECFVKRYSSIANVVSVSHIHVNSFWYLMVAWFTPKASLSLVGEVKSKNDSSSKRIHSVFKEAIRMLQEKGVVFQKPSSSKDLYHVTDHDKELLKVTLDAIKEDCRKPRRFMPLKRR
ncbi:cst complex subunit stn1 [Limosa lapponica baueri]|uniref:CST complex subunit STN1 n=1 Tax=Limosa lapponica baueri TaxID=1758121 RepID=A0A2I0TLA1_LIMLA|nr:cst complex subunit stn1 [Limosa lapponica baueri]